MTQPHDDGVDPRLARNAGISYLHLPAPDVGQAARFYREVFSWNVRGLDTDSPAFDDGTGHVSGRWSSKLTVSRRPGLLPFIYVDDLDGTLERVTGHGGEVVRPAHAEGNLLLAHFRDPAGNVLGLWQAAP